MQTKSKSFKKRYLLPLTSLVGIGAVMTLAVWTSTTYVKGQFSTALYTNLESSVDGTTWKAYDITAAAPNNVAGALVVSAPAGGISSANYATAPVALRVATGTTGTVPVKLAVTADPIGGSITGDGSGVTYEVYSVTAMANCTSATSSSNATLLRASTKVTDPANTTVLTTLSAGTASAAGAATYLCLKVSVDSTVEPNTTHSVQWAFTGTP